MELVRVQTRDGLLLDGGRLSATPAAANADGAPVPSLGFLLIHGTGSSFTHSGVLEVFARQATVLGDVWRVNTRGHGGIVSIPTASGTALGGATHERILDCVHDLDAWLDAIARSLEEPSTRRIILVGHSMGAVKSIYFASKARPDIAAIVAISPPRFCHAHWMAHPNADAFRASWRQALELVESGRGDELVDVTQPVPFLATAAGFVAKYGPHDEYDIVRLAPDVECPILALVGTRSMAASPAFDGLPDALADAAPRCRKLRVEIVEGANTGFAGLETVPFERMVRWLNESVLKSGSSAK